MSIQTLFLTLGNYPLLWAALFPLPCPSPIITNPAWYLYPYPLSSVSPFYLLLCGHAFLPPMVTLVSFHFSLVGTPPLGLLLLVPVGALLLPLNWVGGHPLAVSIFFSPGTPLPGHSRGQYPTQTLGWETPSAPHPTFAREMPFVLADTPLSQSGLLLATWVTCYGAPPPWEPAYPRRSRPRGLPGARNWAR
jgi:hypothetical protein